MLDPKENCISLIVEAHNGLGSLYMGNIYSIEADVLEKYDIKAAVSALKGDPSILGLDIVAFIY
jgi:hypothetical protein